MPRIRVVLSRFTLGLISILGEVPLTVYLLRVVKLFNRTDHFQHLPPALPLVAWALARPAFLTGRAAPLLT